MPCISVQNVFCCLLWCLVGIVQPKADPWCCLHFTKYKFNVYRKKYIRSGRDSAVVGIVGKSKSLDFPTMLIFWSLVRNSVVLAVYLLFSVACFLTVHEHYQKILHALPYHPRKCRYTTPSLNLNEGYFYCIKNLNIPFAQPSQAGTFASSHSTTVGISAVVRSPIWL